MSFIEIDCQEEYVYINPDSVSHISVKKSNNDNIDKVYVHSKGGNMLTLNAKKGVNKKLSEQLGLRKRKGSNGKRDERKKEKKEKK